MELPSAYQQNYEQIARDHVAHWRVTGLNPFQNAAEQKAHENATVELVERYVEHGSFVLDAGCGIGDLMQRLRENYDVVGVDIASPYIEVLAERGLECLHAPVEALPYADYLFDAIIATDILEHVLDLNAALRELLRVLKPGGILVIRVPDQEDLTQYLAPSVPYRFIHLRRFDQASSVLFLTRVFDLEILEMSVTGITLNIVCRKP